MLVLFAAILLYLYGLSSTGLLGPDEPRYAFIGRAMAQSGDWVTPRLWGEPWFEKPALLYWMTGAAYVLGFADDLAPRVPVAALSLAFLALYYRLLRDEFDVRAAAFATAILATTAGWLAFSHAGVTDLPLSATFAAAMLLFRRAPAWAGASWGLAILAKGLVPVVLALPLFALEARRWRGLLRFGLAALAVAAPWYVLVTLRNGSAFVDEFFWRHHFERFATESLKHEQPFWFYVPVVLGALFPWTPLLVLLARPALYREPRTRFLAAWFLFGFLFFSASTNKLPGYILPLVPALSALMGLALSRMSETRLVLAPAALLLTAVPIVAQVLPSALERGLSRAGWPVPHPVLLLPAFGITAFVVWNRRTPRQMAAIVAGVVLSVALLKVQVFPVLDRQVSARVLWRRLHAEPADVCLAGPFPRALEYGLNYYAGRALPPCDEESRPVRVTRPVASRTEF